ncbi:MAG TPA: hypothetical protein VF581_04370 [Flavobacterium sp.]|jgi:hypothetical protein
MTHIQLLITLNNTLEPYRCDIVEHKRHWRCTLYLENFNYEIIKDSTLSDCLEHLANELVKLGHVSRIEGNEDSEMYIAILETHLMINRSNKTMNRQQRNA